MSSAYIELTAGDDGSTAATAASSVGAATSDLLDLHTIEFLFSVAPPRPRDGRSSTTFPSNSPQLLRGRPRNSSRLP
eukprot:COSAG01_NODE_808_length_13418_cov_9.469631_1_plen_77_part_00